MLLALPCDSRTEASIMKLNIIYVSFTFAISKWLYFSGRAVYPELWAAFSLPMLASWYEFFNLATIFRIAVLLAATLRLLGIAPNSIGLCVKALLSSAGEFLPVFGPWMTADCFTKVKSMSRSWGPLFLKGILNFYPFWPFFTTKGMTFSLYSVMCSSF